MEAVVKFDKKENLFCLYSDSGVLLDKHRSMKVLSDKAFKNGVSNIVMSMEK